MGTATIDRTETDAEFADLLSQLMNEVIKNQHLISRILSEMAQAKNITGISISEIEAKMKSSLANSDITSLLTQFKENTKNSALTSAEVSALWLQYMGDSMSICVNKYFLTIVESGEIKSVLQFALQLSESHITKITEFLKAEHFQIPIGFTEKDVKLDAPRLFSDEFLLFYTNIMTIHGLSAYGLAITVCQRQDVLNYFFECAASAKDLFQRMVNLAKARPKFSSVPAIPSPLGVEFVDSTGIIENLFGDKRPLNISEISNLFFNSKKTGFVRSLSIAFSQVAQLEEVRKFMMKNVRLAGKDADSFDAILQNDNLPTPEKWDAEITNSTVSPFSDKLMMFHAAFLVNAALSYYGAAIGSSLRSDMIANYKQVFNHAMQAGVDCYTIMVKHGWLEKQPEAIDRNALALGVEVDT